MPPEFNNNMMKYLRKRSTNILIQKLLLLLLFHSCCCSSSTKTNSNMKLNTIQYKENKVNPPLYQLRKRTKLHLLVTPFEESSSSSLTTICPIDAFLNQIFYFAHDGICYKVDLDAEHGLLQRDITNSDCSNDVYVATDTYSFLNYADFNQKNDASFQFDGRGLG